MEAAPAESAPIVEPIAVEAPVVAIATEEIVAEAAPEPEQPVVEVPLEVFDVAPEPLTVETTLEKAMCPMMESVITEEVQIEAHPLEAPHAAQPELSHAQDENTNTEETEDSNNSQ
jgi:hypothetical protein